MEDRRVTVGLGEFRNEIDPFTLAETGLVSADEIEVILVHEAEALYDDAKTDSI